MPAEQEPGNPYDSAQDQLDLANLFKSMKILPAEPKSRPPLHLYNDAKELEVITIPGIEKFEQKRILSAISLSVCGNVPVIARYLSTSTEKELFLHGKDNSGNTTLIMATAERNHEMVSLLLHHGADVNEVNDNGRSALMEAALWGRTENVEQLLNVKSNKRLRDRDGRCALDLAQPSCKNERERIRRSPYMDAKSISEMDSGRRHIVLLLSETNTKKPSAYSRPLSEVERKKYRFSKSQTEMAITLHGPINSYHVSSISKTAAMLDRGDPFARIPATSGWAADTLPPNGKFCAG